MLRLVILGLQVGLLRRKRLLGLRSIRGRGRDTWRLRSIAARKITLKITMQPSAIFLHWESFSSLWCWANYPSSSQRKTTSSIVSSWSKNMKNFGNSIISSTKTAIRRDSDANNFNSSFRRWSVTSHKQDRLPHRFCKVAGSFEFTTKILVIVLYFICK